MRRSTTIYQLIALVCSGCNLLGGRCTYEIRSLEASGVFQQNASTLADARITLSEQRGSLQGQSISWLVTSTDLKGHVTAAAFKDSSNPSQVLLALPVASADRPEITQGATGSGDGANLGGFHDIIAAGRGVIELQTDIPSQPTVTIQLIPTTVSDWVRPYCS
jgi:hypothetical protein